MNWKGVGALSGGRKSRGRERGSAAWSPKWISPVRGAALRRGKEEPWTRAWLGRVVSEVDFPAGCAGTYEEGLANACDALARPCASGVTGPGTLASPFPFVASFSRLTDCSRRERERERGKPA